MQTIYGIEDLNGGDELIVATMTPAQRADLDAYARAWDAQSAPVDRDPLVPLGAFVIVCLICLATIAALVLA